MIDTLSINFDISGTKIFLPFKAICTVTNKEFSGEIIIEYRPSRKVLEYVNTEQIVNEISKEKTTAEKLAYDVFQEVKKSITPKYLKITIDVKRSDVHRPVQVWIEG